MALERVSDCVGVEHDAFPRVAEVTLTAELVHVPRDEFARRSYVLRDLLVSKRHQLRRTIFHRAPQPLREMNQRPRQPPLHVLRRQALDPPGGMDTALRQHLKQCDAESRPRRHEFFHDGVGPCHDPRVLFHCDGGLTAISRVEQRRFAKEFVDVVDVHHDFTAVIAHTVDFYGSTQNHVEIGRRQDGAVDDRVLFVLQHARASQVCDRVFKWRGCCEGGGTREHDCLIT